MFSVEMTVIPASSSSSTSCQRFSFRDPGTFVCASSSTSATSGLRARIASTSISSNVVPRYSIVRRGTTSRSPICAAGLLATVGLDDADDDVRAAVAAPPPLAEHRERLADARRRAEVDAEGAARPCALVDPIQRSASSARLSARTLTRGSPMNPSVRSCVCSSTSSSTRASSSPRARATRGAWSLRVGGRDVRVEPRARRGHGVHRDGRAVVEPVQLAVRGDALLDRGEEVRVRRAEVRRRARGAVVPVAGGRGARVERPLVGERLAEERRADDDAVTADERAVRPVAERDLRDARHGERVEDADEEREDEERENRGNELATHQLTPSPVRARSTSLMPTKGATTPPAPYTSRLRRSSAAAPTGR